MAERIYYVTLKKKEDLEGFYADMKSDGHRLNLKRPISRVTHYWLTDEAADEIRKDSRVLAVELNIEDSNVIAVPHALMHNYEPVGYTDLFQKDGIFNSANHRDWAKLFCSGTVAQRRKNVWGDGGSGPETVTDTAEWFNNGKHVDVVICDQPVSIDMAEWNSPSTGMSRYVQYQWYQELNGYVSSIDDDGYTLPTGPYPNYVTNANNLSYHGTHVAGTVAGQFYGWATEANIYSMGLLSGAGGSTIRTDPMLAFDYLRAFHRYKPINPETGFRNPTITNHSWGYSIRQTDIWEYPITEAKVLGVSWLGTWYTASNPNPSGWTFAGLEADFGYNVTKNLQIHNAANYADVEDAIQDGVVVIGAAGNSDDYAPEYPDQYWNNFIHLDFPGSSYYWYGWRGSSPSNVTGIDQAINVGNLSNYADFRKSASSTYGPGIAIWAPGSDILSCFNNSTGYLDTKYGGDNFFKAISGTSMASPQVAGVAACLATNKMRFTNRDLIGYLEYASIKDEMSWDLGTAGSNYFIDINGINSTQWDVSGTDASGAISGNNIPITIMAGDALWFSQPYGGSHYYLTSASSSGYFGHVYDRQSGYGQWQYNQNNYTITVEKGDVVRLSFNGFTSNEPIYIKTQNTTGTGNQVNSGVTNQGATSGSIYFYTDTQNTGTYYYCSSNNSGASGTINVVNKGSIYNHPLYIVTQAGSTGGTNLWTGSGVNNGDVWYQGETHSLIQGAYRFIWFTTQYNQGGQTIYYQCGNHANMYGEINIAQPPGNINAPGNWGDSTRRGGSPDAILSSTNPRDISKMIGAWNISNNGRRFSHSTDLNTLQTVQNFPRTNTLFHN